MAPWSGDQYSLPAGTTVSPNTTIQSTWANTLTADLASGMNFTRPVARGGTGAVTAVGAADNLSTISTDIASSSTTDLSTATGIHVTITGTTTITGFGTEQAGAIRILTFEDALTLTHNATSLILPNGSNFTTSAGDVFEFTSEGSGNWRCTGYALANGQAISGQPGETTSAKTSAYTVTTADDQSTILCDATSAAFTVTLPAAADVDNGFSVTVKKTDSTSNAVTVDGDASETIDGATTYVLSTQNKSATLISDGVDSWYVQSDAGTSMALVSSGVFSSTATLDITEITEDVQEVIIILNGVVMATDGDSIGIRVSTDGSTFDVGTGYDSVQIYAAGGGVNNANSGSSIMYLNGLGGSGNAHRLSNNSERQFSCHARVIQPARSDKQTQLLNDFSHVRQDGVYQGGITRGRRTASQADVALRLQGVNGNITSGTYAVFMMKRSQ